MSFAAFEGSKEKLGLSYLYLSMWMMAKIYVASCMIVLGFFVLLHLPWDLLPFSDGVNIALVGAALLAFAAYYTFYFHRRERFEFGWFLAQRGGFWVFAVGLLGSGMIAFGMLALVSPQVFVPAVKQGAQPFGIALVSLFWLALIYLFGYLSVGMVARTVASLRRLSVGDVLANGAISLVCISLTGLFFSLFLEVLNDILMRIGVDSQWTAIWAFVGAVGCAGVIYGILKEPSYNLDDDPSSEENE